MLCPLLLPSTKPGSDRTGPDRTGPDHGSDHEKQNSKEKKIPKNQIVYEIIINKNKSGKLKNVK